MFPPNRKPRNHRLAILGPAALLILLGSAPFAAAQEKCPEQIAKAEQAYINGSFDEAIVLLTTCLEAGQLNPAEKLRVYKLLGLAYIGKDYVEQAQSAIRKLLELVPQYEPDPAQDPPGFANMVQEMKKAIAAQKQQKEPAAVKKGGKKKWLWIGGGVVAAGVTVVALSGGGGEEGPAPASRLLPNPPDLP